MEKGTSRVAVVLDLLTISTANISTEPITIYDQEHEMNEEEGRIQVYCGQGTE